jgi:lipopolysaccharide heptosyltransferase II
MSLSPFPIGPALAHAPRRRAAPLPWGTEVERILCVRLDRLGDVLMTTPALHALREAAPGRHLTLLTSPSGAQIAPFLRDVDDVIAYDAPWVGSAAQRTPSLDLRLRHKLECGAFDAAVIFTVYSQSPLPAAMMCYLAGIPRRLAHCRENPYDLLTDCIGESEPQCGTRHEVERQLELVAHIGAASADKRLRFDVGDAARRSLERALVARGIDPHGPWFVLHPGASAASRRYPPERFGEAAARLARRMPLPILVTGGPDEREQAAGVIGAAGPAARSQLHDLSGILNLGELAALLERAAVLIANNSGPVHVAAALGTPVVDLYALTNPQHTPWLTAHRVLFRDVECRWCYRSICPEGHHACLLGVPASEVADAAMELAAWQRAVAPRGAPAVGATELAGEPRSPS